MNKENMKEIILYIACLYFFSISIYFSVSSYPPKFGLITLILGWIFFVLGLGKS